jgi:thioredoxin reductase
MNNKDAKVVIVGAGGAGLSAAHHLIINIFNNNKWILKTRTSYLLLTRPQNYNFTHTCQI